VGKRAGERVSTNYFLPIFIEKIPGGLSTQQVFIWQARWMCVLKVGPARERGRQHVKVLPRVVVSFNGTWSARVICKRIEYLVSLIFHEVFEKWLFAFGSLPICQNVFLGFFPSRRTLCL